MGYQIIAVSPDQPENLRKSVDKHSLSYTLVSDSKMTASKAFGLAHKVNEETLRRYRGFGIDLEKASGERHHLLPVPAVFVVGPDGTIKFQYVNPDHRIRLDAEVLLAAAKAYLK